MRHIRICTAADLPAALQVCAQDPIGSVFVTSRLTSYGIEKVILGCPVWGAFDEQGSLISLLHLGANLVPVNADMSSLAAFAAKLEDNRVSCSIMGPATQVIALYEMLRLRKSWARPRQERLCQPLLVCDAPPLVSPDPLVGRISVEHAQSYIEASVRMYTEEVGISPLSPDGSYERHVRQTLREGRGFGVIVDGRVVFKADIGASFGQVAQIQGVWLDPTLRGRGLATSAMAAVVAQIQQEYGIASLYVNDFNKPALATYRAVGFRQVGEFATILY
ncbi:MAG: GNAT family N-acetyltransferase [Propionibacteriaceae bacterium]